MTGWGILNVLACGEYHAHASDHGDRSSGRPRRWMWAGICRWSTGRCARRPGGAGRSGRPGKAVSARSTSMRSSSVSFSRSSAVSCSLASGSGTAAMAAATPWAAAWRRPSFSSCRALRRSSASRRACSCRSLIFSAMARRMPRNRLRQEQARRPGAVEIAGREGGEPSSLKGPGHLQGEPGQPGQHLGLPLVRGRRSGGGSPGWDCIDHVLIRTKAEHLSQQNLTWLNRHHNVRGRSRWMATPPAGRSCRPCCSPLRWRQWC
ncbi:hypothetical protein QFZ27_003519 [Inquilinus ginsengisoli]